MLYPYLASFARNWLVLDNSIFAAATNATFGNDSLTCHFLGVLFRQGDDAISRVIWSNSNMKDHQGLKTKG